MAIPIAQLSIREMQLLSTMAERPEEVHTVEILASGQDALPSKNLSHVLSQALTRLVEAGLCKPHVMFLKTVKSAQISERGLNTAMAYAAVADDYLPYVSKAEVRLFLALYSAYSSRWFTMDDASLFNATTKASFKQSLTTFINLNLLRRGRSRVYHFTMDGMVAHGLLSDEYLRPFLFPSPPCGLRIIHWLLTQGQAHTIYEIAAATGINEDTVHSTIAREHRLIKVASKTQGEKLYSVDMDTAAKQPTLRVQLMHHGLKSPFDE